MSRLQRGFGVPCYYLNQSATKNLLTNGDIETALSGTVNAFDDQFADGNAWTPALPAPAANVVTPVNGTIYVAGHTEWWDWAAGSQLRFKWVTSGALYFYIRYTDANNWVRVSADGTNINISKAIAGTITSITSVAAALVTGNWYWFNPVITGTTYSATLVNDNAGANTGTTVATIGNTTISDSAVATGPMAVQTGGAAITIGGNFADVCLVKIAAPPGWVATVNAGVPAFCVSKTTKFSGTYSLSIFNNDSGANARWDNSWTAAATATHTASGRVKTSSVAGAGTGANIIASAGAGTPSAGSFAGTNDWTVRSASGSITAGGQALTCNLDTASGTAWFDLLWLAQASFDAGNTPGTYVADHASGETCISVLARKAGSSGIRKLDNMAAIVAQDVIAKIVEGRAFGVIDTSHATGESCVETIRRVAA